MILDVSSAQGVINWPSVYASGIRHAYVQISQGGSRNGAQRERERAGRLNVIRAHAAGLEVGVYHYAHPRVVAQDAIDEGVVFAGACEPILDRLTLPPALDYEEWGALTPGAPRAREEWISRWLEESGAPSTLLYCPRSKCSRFPASLAARMPLWVAWYPWGDAAPPTDHAELLRVWDHHASLSPWRHAELWQCSSSGSVPGIHGRVDVSVDVRQLPEDSR